MDTRRSPGTRAGLTADAVLVAGRELVEREGVDALTMRRLAETLGVAQHPLWLLPQQGGAARRGPGLAAGRDPGAWNRSEGLARRPRCLMTALTGDAARSRGTSFRTCSHARCAVRRPHALARRRWRCLRAGDRRRLSRGRAPGAPDIYVRVRRTPTPRDASSPIPRRVNGRARRRSPAILPSPRMAELSDSLSRPPAMARSRPGFAGFSMASSGRTRPGLD